MATADVQDRDLLLVEDALVRDLVTEMTVEETDPLVTEEMMLLVIEETTLLVTATIAKDPTGIL